MSVNVEAPVNEKVDKWGFTIKQPISDDLLMLRCLRNAPCGSDQKQVARLCRIIEAKLAAPTGPYHLFPQPKPGI
jgi:hypothetical protein